MNQIKPSRAVPIGWSSPCITLFITRDPHFLIDVGLVWPTRLLASLPSSFLPPFLLLSTPSLFPLPNLQSFLNVTTLGNHSFVTA